MRARASVSFSAYEPCWRFSRARRFRRSVHQLAASMTGLSNPNSRKVGDFMTNAITTASTSGIAIASSGIPRRSSSASGVGREIVGGEKGSRRSGKRRLTR